MKEWTQLHPRRVLFLWNITADHFFSILSFSFYRLDGQCPKGALHSTFWKPTPTPAAVDMQNAKVAVGNRLYQYLQSGTDHAYLVSSQLNNICVVLRAQVWHITLSLSQYQNCVYNDMITTILALNQLAWIVIMHRCNSSQHLLTWNKSRSIRQAIHRPLKKTSIFKFYLNLSEIIINYDWQWYWLYELISDQCVSVLVSVCV